MVSRPTITPTPSIDARPSKSILKKSGSTSTYGTGKGSDQESDSGLANASYGQNHSYDNDPNNSAGRYGVYKIETLPDPGRHGNGQVTMAGTGLAGSPAMGLGFGAGIQEQSSMDSDQQIPVPMRVSRNKRRSQSPSVTGGRQNPSYHADPDDVAVNADGYTPRRQVEQYANAGYDQQAQPQAPARKERDPEAAERRRQRRAKRAEKEQAAAGTPNEAFHPQEEPTPGQTHPQYSNLPTTVPTEPLHINIHAQRGTEVHITPGTQYRQGPRPAASQSSVETEIWETEWVNFHWHPQQLENKLQPATVLHCGLTAMLYSNVAAVRDFTIYVFTVLQLYHRMV